MPPLETILLVAAIVVLVGGDLIVIHRKALRVRPRFDITGRIARPVDATRLKPLIEKVRRDYLTARKPARCTSFHRNLLGLSRKTVAALSYFQDRQSEEPVKAHWK